MKKKEIGMLYYTVHGVAWEIQRHDNNLGAAFYFQILNIPCPKPGLSSDTTSRYSSLMRQSLSLIYQKNTPFLSFCALERFTT
jgi:hypothetical protein